MSSCTSDQNSSNEELPDLSHNQQKVMFNTDNGYTKNQFNGQDILPILNSIGDTVVTGKSILLSGIERELTGEKRRLPFEMTFTDTIKDNKHLIPENLPSQELNAEMLEERRLNSIVPDYYLINTTGDTIETGIPVEIEAVEKPYYYTEPKEILDFSINKDATMDIQYLDMEHGLKSSYIRSMLHDSKGQIWIGSDGSGLAKYDGESIGYFNNNENLTENTLFSIIEDNKGNIWASSFSHPVIKFDGKKFTTYPQANGMPNNFIFSLFEDSKGNIWFGSGGFGLSRFDGEKFIHFSKKEGLSSNRIHGISEAHNGNILVSTLGGGLNILNPDLIGKKSEDLFQKIDETNGLSDNSVHDAIMDKNGVIWIGTYGGGLYEYNGKEIINYTTESGLSSNRVNDIYEDKSGNIWIGTYAGGLNLFERGSSLSGQSSFTHISEQEGLNNNIVLNISEDNSGRILIGTDGGGLNRLTPNSFKNYTEKSGLGIKYINDILEDQHRNIWLSTWGAGLDFISENKVCHINFDKDIFSSVIWEIEERSNGDLIFATSQKGLMTFDGSSFEFISEENGLPENFVRSVSEDQSHIIWIGMRSEGIAKIVDNKITLFDNTSGLCGNDIMHVYVDSEDNVWVGTREAGVSKIFGDSIINFTEREGLSSNGVWSINQDSRGNMWFGTESGGVNMFDGEKFTYFNENSGLEAPSVLSIIEDRNGTIWIGTSNGLASVDYTSANESETNTFHIKNYSRQDGLKGTDFYQNSSYLDGDNNLWFGTGKGLAQRNVTDFKISSDPPVPQLNWVSINEQVIDFRNLPDSLKKTVLFDEVAEFENYPTNLSVPHNFNHLNFHFSAIEWNAPHQIKYSFRIKELKSTWSKPNKASKADYRNIPPGDYTFEFITCGQSGEWSEPFEFKFQIRPPWWQTTWAKAILALLIILLIVLIFKWRTRQLKMRQKMLVQEVKSATKEIHAQKVAVEKAHAETEKQKEIIEESHKEITDSIAYAKRLQDAILPSLNEIAAGFHNSFVLFQPKDVVSGDFYWYEKANPKGNEIKYIAAADCTGHGVPGALVSVVCSNALNRSLNEFGITEPNLILDKARELVIKTFAKSGDGVKDGMDISLCSIEANKLKYAGANNPLWIIRKTDKISEREKNDPKTVQYKDLSLIELKSDKQPVGMHSGNQSNFTQIEIELFEGDTVFLFTDGFPDQFGGSKGKKYKYKPFKSLLLSLYELECIKQKERILKELNDWKGNLEQVDDVCVIGVRI